MNIQIHAPAALVTRKEFPVLIHNVSELSSEKIHPCPNYELGTLTGSPVSGGGNIQTALWLIFATLNKLNSCGICTSPRATYCVQHVILWFITPWKNQACMSFFKCFKLVQIQRNTQILVFVCIPTKTHNYLWVRYWTVHLPEHVAMWPAILLTSPETSGPLTGQIINAAYQHIANNSKTCKTVQILQVPLPCISYFVVFGRVI